MKKLDRLSTVADRQVSSSLFDWAVVACLCALMFASVQIVATETLAALARGM